MRQIVLSLAVLFCCAVPTLAQDQVYRLPDGANAVMVIRVPAILDSDFAKQKNLRSELTRNSYDRPLAVPADATRVVSAASIDLDTMDPHWQASITESPTPLNLERLAAAQRGYVDTIEGKNVTQTASNAFFAQSRPGAYAVLWPADRQRVARMLRERARPLELAPVLADALKSDQHLTLAINLADAYSAPGIFHSIQDGSFASLDKFDGNIAKLADALASVQSVQLDATFRTGIEGRVAVTFTQDVSALGPYANQFARESMACVGIDASELEKWSFSAKGNRITGRGPVGEQMLRQVTTLFTPPPAPEELSDSQSQEDPQKAKASASAKYFRAVAQIVDRINFQQASLQQTAVYLRTQALAIERLPVLNVDPALQDWAGNVAEAFNRSAQTCITGQNQALASSQGVASPVSYNTYGTAYSTNANSESRAAFRNAQAQRREAGASQRTQTLDAVTAVINDAIAPRTDVRKQMTEKYGVDF